MRVKIFKSFKPSELEKDVNSFIEENGIDIIGLAYTITEITKISRIVYSCMIYYKGGLND